MSALEKKVVVLKAETRATVRPEVLDRDFLIELRRSLLQQLAVIEKRLNIARRCNQCGFDLSTR